MTDNVNITPGTGKTVAADNIAGVLHQRVKLSVGGDGEAEDLDHGQKTMAASLPVAIASDQSTVPVSVATVPSHEVTNAGTFAVQESGDALTALQTLNNIVSGSEAQVDVVAALPAGDNNIGNVDIASIAAGENLIGKVGFPDIVVTVTPTLDTSAYAAGDLLFDSTEVADAARVNAGTCILQNVTILDKSDQGVAMTLLFANAATDFGALNGAPDPDDTEAGTVICWMPVEDTDYIDLGASRVACITNLGLLMQAGAATTSIYIAAINGTGTPTYADGDLVLKLAFMRA